MNVELIKQIEQYDRAEITIIALQNHISNKYFNVYSNVEMCPKGQIESEKICSENNKFIFKREKINNQYNLYLYRYFTQRKEEVIQYLDGYENMRRDIPGLAIYYITWDQ